MPEKKKSKKTRNPGLLRRLGIGLGIAIVLTLLLHAGISLFYARPTADLFCDETQTLTSTEYDALYPPEKNVSVERNTYAYERTIVRDTSAEGAYVYIDRSQECYTQFLTAQEVYERNGYIIILVAFIVTMLIGVFLRSNKAISGGFIGGSLIMLVSGVIRFWEGIDAYARFVMLVIALGALLWLGWKRVRDEE